MNKNWQLKEMLYIVTLATVSIVLGLIEIPWIIIPQASFLKLDFSEVAILVSLVLLGVDNTFIVVLIRTVARRLVRGMGPADWLGEGLAIAASMVIIVSYLILLKIMGKKDKSLIKEKGNDLDLSFNLKEMIYGMLITSGLLMIVLFVLNLFLTTPLYLNLTLGDPAWNIKQIINGESMMFANFKEFFNFVAIAFIPFNFVKGVLVTGVFFAVRPHLKAIIF